MGSSPISDTSWTAGAAPQHYPNAPVLSWTSHSVRTALGKTVQLFR